MIAPLLLEFFSVSFCSGVHEEPTSGLPSSAPWSWSTNDRKLAKALEKRLAELGVRDELCTVHAEPERFEGLASEMYSQWRANFIMTMSMDPVMRKMIPPEAVGEDKQDDLYEVCRKQSSSLKRCSKCKAVWYCSRERKAADWRSHKKICKNPDDPNNMGAFDYYHSVAHTVLEAQQLARWLVLTIPSPRCPREGIL